MRSPHSPASHPDLIHRILDDAYQHHGGTVLVDGLSGMGKTFFLRNLALEAQRRNHWPVTFVHTDRFEQGEPFSFIERLLAAGIAPDWHFDPEAQQQRPLAVARECVRRLTGKLQTAEQGHVIIIDDAQWIDAESATVLRHMIPRFNRRNVLIACGARTPHSPSSLGEYLLANITQPHDHHLALPPLTADDIRALAYERFGASISRSNAEELLELSGGSFLGVESVFNRVTDDEVKKLHTTWNIPLRNVELTNPLLGEYLELSSDTQAIIQLVCLAEHELSPAILRAAVQQLNLPDAIGAALQSGIIREADFGQSIVPRHDLIAAAVRDTVEPTFARSTHQTLASLTVGFRSVRHHLKGAKRWTPALRERTNTYVTEAQALGHFTNASEILRMALTIAKDASDRQELVTDLVLLNIRAKTGYHCLDLLPEVEAMPNSMVREFMAVMLRVHLVDQAFPQARVQAILAAPAATPDDLAVQAFLMFLMVMMTMRSPDRSQLLTLIPMAQGLLSHGPQHPGQLADPRLAWMVTPHETSLLLECYKIVQWHLNGEIDATSTALPDLIEQIALLDDGPAKTDCLVPLAGAAMATGDVNLAHELAAQAVHLLDHTSGDPWAAATPRIILAHTLVLLGQYARASLVLDDFEEINHEALDLEARLTGAALRAIIDVTTGGQHYEQFVAHAQRSAELHWEYYGRDLATMATVEIARSNQDHEAVIAAADAPQLRTYANTQRGYLTYQAHALVSLGQLDEAQALVARLRKAHGTSWFEYWGSLDWLEARLAEATGDHANASTHYTAAIRQQHFPLPRALAHIDYGAFLLSRGQHEHAETMLKVADSLLQEIGAYAYLPAAQDLLRRTSQTRQDATSRAFTDMTAREQEIAGMLAEGLSNRSIAQRLVISDSTVRFHVSNILRKLQLTSRAEVPQFFQQAQADPTTGPPRQR